MLDKGTTTRAVAAHFGCGRTQISSIKGNKEEIMKEWEAGTRPDLKYVKRRKTVYENVNTNFQVLRVVLEGKGEAYVHQRHIDQGRPSIF